MEPQIGIRGRECSTLTTMVSARCFNGAPDRNPGKGARGWRNADCDIPSFNGAPDRNPGKASICTRAIR